MTEYWLKNKKDIALEDRVVFGRQKPQSVTVCAGVTTDGRKTPLIFIEEGVKVNKDVYLALFKDEVLPWLQFEYSDAPYVFTQDYPIYKTLRKRPKKVYPILLEVKTTALHKINFGAK